MNHQYFIPEPHHSPGKPDMLIYSSCHVHGILRYLNEHRPEVRRQYNVSAVIVHKAAEQRSSLSDPALLNAFHSASSLLHHPLASEKWAGFRAEEIGLKNSCIKVAMESPQFGAAWPFHSVSYSDEAPVRDMLKSGADEEQIKRAFDSGDMDCQFEKRFKHDAARMFERETSSDLLATRFVIDNFKRQKMFFTPNHPTMAVIGFMVDQFLNRLGHPLMGEEHALSLPLMTDVGENHYPETDYEFNHYGFQYPMRYADNMGGRKFYHSEIDRICEA